MRAKFFLAKVEEELCRGITRAEGGHSAAGHVPVCWSLDINRTALNVHAVLPASRDAFFPKSIKKSPCVLTPGSLSC